MDIMETIVYTFGLLLVLVYVALGVDDLIWDIITFRKISQYKEKQISMSELDNELPKLLAVIVASWQESAILEDVIENLIISAQYPKSMYHVFLGVYPNDTKTVDAAQRLDIKFPNVHCIVNVADGPTSKAQNINNVLKEIKKFETTHNWQFASVTIHDSEDIVHPNEFKITNVLLNQFDSLQFPVFPLQQMPRFSNFFKNLTSSTYADEFAENHYRIMVLRDSTLAFVPSAGTGFVLSRKILESYGTEDVFPDGSLTEDYKLSLILKQRGFHVHYVLEKVQRLNSAGLLVWDYVSTRSRFPTTYKLAVRQKTRWIYGITMQSFKFKDIFAKNENFSSVSKYTLYKDWKAKVGNLLNLFGYIAFIYFILSIIFPLTTMYPYSSLSWWLCIALTCIMIEKQILRSIAIANVYGYKSMLFACFLPPLIPIRMVWGNIINFHATVRAWGLNTVYRKQEKISKKAKVEKNKERPNWSKTNNTFLGKDIIKRYHRNLGDVLLRNQYITDSVLKKTLHLAAASNMRLGEYLVKLQIVTEEQLLICLAQIKQTQYVEIREGILHPEYSKELDKAFLEEMNVCPLLKTPTGFAVAFCDKSPNNAQTQLREKYNISINAVFAKENKIKSALEFIYSKKEKNIDCPYCTNLYEKGNINYEQLIILQNFKEHSGFGKEEEIIIKMGLDTKR